MLGYIATFTTGFVVGGIFMRMWAGWAFNRMLDPLLEKSAELVDFGNKATSR